MTNKKRTRQIIDEFIMSDQQVLILSFDGTHENVSDHWHDFLTDDHWRFLKKGIIPRLFGTIIALLSFKWHRSFFLKTITAKHFWHEICARTQLEAVLLPI